MQRRTFLALGAAVALPGMIGACTRATAPLAPEVPVAGLTSEEMGRCLSVAGRKRGWSVLPVDEHHAEATLVKGEHVAVLDITFDEKMFRIQVSPKTSATLIRPDGLVHRKLNRWINNFQTDTIRLMSDQKAKKMMADRPTSF